MTAGAVTTLRLVAGESEQAGWTLTGADGRALFRVGSAPDCNWRVVAPGVAPQQFMLLWNGSELAIIDVGAGPVRLDGELLEGTAIVRSGRIQFGAAALVVESAGGRGIVRDPVLESSGSTTAQTLGPTTPRSSAPAYMSDVITVVAAGAGDVSHGTPIPSRSEQERPTERDLSVPVLETAPTGRATPAARGRAAAEGRATARRTASLPARLAVTRPSLGDVGATIPDAAPRAVAGVRTATMGSPRVDTPTVLVGGRAAPAEEPARLGQGTPPSMPATGATAAATVAARPSAPKVTVAPPAGKPRPRPQPEPARPLPTTRVVGEVQPPAPPPEEPPPAQPTRAARRLPARTWLLLGVTLAAGAAVLALPVLRAAPDAAPPAAAASGGDAGPPPGDASVPLADAEAAPAPDAAPAAAAEAAVEAAGAPPAPPLDLVDRDDPLATLHCKRRRRCAPHTRERVAADLVAAGELAAAADRYAALAADTGEERFAILADILVAGAGCRNGDDC